MKEETLKRDLCARLPYGVKLKHSEITFRLVQIDIDEDLAFGQSYLSMDDGYYPYYMKSIKPILFPTSALTNEIQIASYNNGEPFVPADEMAEIIEDLWFNDEYTREQFAYEYVNGYVRLNPDTFEKINNFFNKVHINYRLSPEQFIEVTDEFNPYKCDGSTYCK